MIFEEINFPQMALIWPADDADEFKSISEICANNLRDLWGKTTPADNADAHAEHAEIKTRPFCEICANNLRDLRESFQLQNKNHSI